MLWPCDLVTVLLLSAECVVWFWFGPLWYAQFGVVLCLRLHLRACAIGYCYAL